MGAAFDRVTEALRTNGWKTKASGRERITAQCPAHGGDDLNLAVAAGDQGVLVQCHSHGCSAVDIAAGLGLKIGDFFDNQCGTDYDYGGGHHVRRTRTTSGKGKAITQVGAPKTGAATTLYRHPMSEPLESPSEFVTIVEGEKCVDIALRMGLRCVTTWPMGAGAADRVNLEPLAGQRVQILADNDTQGHKAAATLARRLQGIASVEGVWIVLGDGNDIEHLYMHERPLTDLIPLDIAAMVAEDEADAEREEPARALDLLGLEDVEVEPLRWLWEDMIPSRGVTLMAGQGGVAKSTFALYLAGKITRGTIQGDLFGKPGTVLYVSHEDSLSQVVKPRAIANDVDISRLKILGIRVRELGGLSVVPNLPQDMPLLRDAIEQTGAKVVIIDPITSTLSGGDNDKLADVRQIMNPLTAMCEELDVTVLAIAHFRKGTGNASHMIAGSHAWRDSARASLLFAKEDVRDVPDGDAPKTIITLDKANYAPDSVSYGYHVEEHLIPNREGTMTRTTRVIWDGLSDTTVSDIINRTDEKGRQGGLANEIVEYLRSFQGRAVPTNDIVAMFAIGGVAPKTVTSSLTRIKKRGLIESPAYGQWQVVDPSRARGGAEGAVPAVVEGRTAGTAGTAGSPASAHARVIAQDHALCNICGYPLANALVEAGEATHPNC